MDTTKGQCGPRSVKSAAKRTIANIVAMLAVVMTLVMICAVPTVAQERTSTGHVYPLGRSSWNHACGGWLSRDSAHGGCYFNGYYHIGEDMMAAIGSSVYSVANGKVIAIYTSNAYDNYGLGAYNSVIFVQHTLSDGTPYIGTYMHVRPRVGVGANVSAGQVIATVGPYPYGNHLHFAIRPGTTVPLSRWGMMPNYLWSGTNGFVDPANWIRTRYPSGGVVLPSLIVPENSAGCTFGGTPSYLHTVTGIGDGNSLVWTYVNGYSQDNYAIYRPNIPSPGRYIVKVFVPRAYATSRQAPYEVHHKWGVTTVRVSQWDYYDVWVTLGAFDFDAGTGGYVKLSDATGEAYNGSTKLCFDTIKWEGATSVAIASPTMRSASTVELSTSSVDSAKSIVGLTFTGALNEVSATDANNYVVKVNGEAIAVKLVTYDKTTNSVTVNLPVSSVKTGEVITVSYSVITAEGQPVTGTTQSIRVP